MPTAKSVYLWPLFYSESNMIHLPADTELKCWFASAAGVEHRVYSAGLLRYFKVIHDPSPSFNQHRIHVQFHGLLDKYRPPILLGRLFRSKTLNCISLRRFSCNPRLFRLTRSLNAPVSMVTIWFRRIHNVSSAVRL